MSHVRGDRTRWLEEPLLPAERALLADFEQLRCDLNRESYLGLFDFEAHYAWYPSGTGYVRHVDQSGTRQHRQVSVVLYLNPHWRPADGGHLRFFDAEGYIDIEPIAGRLVYFLSAGREHEVLTTRTDRWSIAGWFRLRERAVN